MKDGMFAGTMVNMSWPEIQADANQNALVCCLWA
jgi:hypothetical protein